MLLIIKNVKELCVIRGVKDMLIIQVKLIFDSSEVK